MQQVVRDETGGLDLGERTDRQRSAVNLLASLTGVNRKILSHTKQ